MEIVSTPEPEKTFDPDQWLIVYDGVEYPLPLPVTPREDGRIQRLTGGTWKQAFASIQELSLSALSALVIVAQQRQCGPRAVIDEDQILDDVKFLERFEFRQVTPEVVDGVPPAVAVAASNGAAEPSATTSEIPASSGAQS